MGNYFQFIEKFMSNTEHTLENAENTRTHNFITQIIDEDLASGKHKSVHTRFPLSQTAICTLATPNRFA